MALTSAKKRKVTPLGRDPIVKHFNIATATTIFAGAHVSLNATNGEAKNAPVTGAEFYMGIAQNTVDNQTGSSTTDFPLIVETESIERMVMDVAPDPEDIGQPVYYTDNDEVSLTIVAVTGVAQSQVGILTKIISGTDVQILQNKAVST